MNKLFGKFIRNTSKNNIKYLGRWNTVIDTGNKKINTNINNNIEKNCDWANHDHCGGELCRIPEKNVVAKCDIISTNKKIKKHQDLREEDIVGDTMVYYIM
tara:strand:+ start:937 stop:1239 length:303 start_codon:yes stop_codon:yes gene_type:complete